MSTLDEGPLRRAVLDVALPATWFQLLIFANNFVDYFWLQRLGDDHLGQCVFQPAAARRTDKSTSL